MPRRKRFRTNAHDYDASPKRQMSVMLENELIDELSKAAKAAERSLAHEIRIRLWHSIAEFKVGPESAEQPRAAVRYLKHWEGLAD